jgi:hypothetical protein
MLRRVNQQERKTGRFSSIRHIVDMTGYGQFVVGLISTLFLASYFGLNGTIILYLRLWNFGYC